MKTEQAITDKMAIGLSVACAIHCLFLPVVILMLPSIAALNLDNEAFHLWMVIAVIPCSIYALSLGCKEHSRYQFISWGFTGLAMLVLALALAWQLMSGVIIIAVAMTPFGVWRLRRMDLVEKVKDLSQ